MKKQSSIDLHAACTLNKSEVEKLKVTDKEMLTVMEEVSMIQERIQSERERSRERCKFTLELKLTQYKSTCGN